MIRPDALRRRTLARYLLFQVPGWLAVGAGLYAAVRWWDLDPAWAWIAAALWLAKDAVLYPILRRAYEPDGAAPHGPVRERGAAEDPLDEAHPEGWVRLGAERWRARRTAGAAPIAAGAPVRVVGLEGLVLRVEPDREERSG